MKRRRFSKYLAVGGLSLTGIGYSSLLSCNYTELRDEQNNVLIRNKQVTVILDKMEKGKIISFMDNATGQEFVAQSSPSELFRLGLSDPGDKSGEMNWITNLDAGNVNYLTEENEIQKTVQLIFSDFDRLHLKVRCSVSVSSEDDLILWSFSLEGQDSLILEEVCFPMVTMRAPLNDKDISSFVSGQNRGGKYNSPGQWEKGRGLHLNHPGSLAAQFSCYYNACCGFYSATQDNKGYPKRLQFIRTESGLEYNWKHYCYHNILKPFNLDYPVAMTSFRSENPDISTDWYDAADIYKAWALKQPFCAKTIAERDNLPAWLKEGFAMVKFRRKLTYFKPDVRLEYQSDRYTRFEEIKGWLKDYWKQNFPDVPLVVILWGWEKNSTWISPDYFPPYPSEEGLYDRIKEVRDVGGHPFLWPSGYKWAVSFGKKEDGTFQYEDHGSFEKFAKSHAVITRNGTPWSREEFWMDGGTNYNLCRGDSWTRDWLNDITSELTKRGADIIQIDQVTGGCTPGEASTCYSELHNHPSGPDHWFTESFIEQLQTMHETCSSLNPDIVLGFEGEQEFYFQQTGIQDYRDFEIYWEPRMPGHLPANVFGYLYHEFVPLFQSNPEGKRGKPLGGNMLIMASCIVNGQIPHLVSHWPLEPYPALKNGDFGQWNGGLPDHWTVGETAGNLKVKKIVYRDDEVTYNGKVSLRVENSVTGSTTNISQTMGVGEYEREVGSHGPEIGKNYRLIFQYKTERSGTESKITVNSLNTEEDKTGNWDFTLQSGPKWQLGEIFFKIPESTVQMQVILQTTGISKIWLSGLSLEEKDDAGEYHMVMEKPILEAEEYLGRQWVKLFHGEGKPYLLLGKMLHPPKMEVDKVVCPPFPLEELPQPRREWPAILHNAYRAPDGSEAVIAVNITDQNQTGNLSRNRKKIKINLSPWEIKLIRDI
jgi:hypothetical protein